MTETRIGGRFEVNLERRRRTKLRTGFLRGQYYKLAQSQLHPICGGVTDIFEEVFGKSFLNKWEEVPLTF